MSSSCSDSPADEDVRTGDHYPQNSSGSSLVFYALLPSLVQRRISGIRSLKRKFSQHDSRARHNRISSCTSEGSVTPPPSYHSNDDIATSEEQTTMFRWLQPSLPSSRPSSSGSAAPPFVEEPGSGIRWKYADPGFASLKLAQSEEESASPLNPHFIRRQYVDGVACILRGLPLDLTEEEELSLREALPITLTPSEPAHDRSVARSCTRDVLIPAARPSNLHQWVATATLNMFLLISYVLPYLHLMLREAYQFDRKYKISDKMLAHGMVAADVMSKRTMTVAARVCAMNDGKVGESMKDVGLYFVQGLSGGVYDGLGEGVQILGLRARNGKNIAQGDKEQ